MELLNPHVRQKNSLKEPLTRPKALMIQRLDTSPRINVRLYIVDLNFVSI